MTAPASSPAPSVTPEAPAIDGGPPGPRTAEGLASPAGQATGQAAGQAAGQGAPAGPASPLRRAQPRRPRA